MSMICCKRLAWEENGENGPGSVGSCFALYTNCTPVLVHQAMGKPEAQARADVLFGRVKRLKDLSHLAAINAATIIHEANTNTRPMTIRLLTSRPGLNPEAAAFVHGLNGISHQI